MGGRVRRGARDGGRERAEPAPEAREHVLPVLGVLVEDADPRARPSVRADPTIERPLAREPREKAHRPRVALALQRQCRETAPHEELRNGRLVQIWADGERVLRADAAEDREDLVVLDELPRLADGLGRVVRVVDVAERDLAAPDPAVVVDVAEVRVRAARDGGVRDLVAAERHGRAEEDRVVRDPRLAAASAMAPGSPTTSRPAATSPRSRIGPSLQSVS